MLLSKFRSVWAARVGAVWGLGHGVSATLLGTCAWLFKNGVRRTAFGGSFDLLHHAGSFVELAVGVSLVLVGLLGIKEAREFEASPGGGPRSLSSAAAPEDDRATNAAESAVLFNGILHGFSWDGAPSLAPAIAVSTWRGSMAFLLSYALGTMAAMTLATSLIGEGTRRASHKLERPNLPRDLSLGSSVLALIVGMVWCGLALR